MDNVISLAAVRAERARTALSNLSRTAEPAIVETRSGRISAQKITCHKTFAEILNCFGDYFVVDYADVRSVRPAALAQTSVLDARGNFVSAPDVAPTPSAVAILPFARRRSRKAG
jgi:hypothetical protein